MIDTAWYLIILTILGGVGYALGFFVFPRGLPVAVPPFWIARVVFVVLVVFLIARSTVVFITMHDRGQPWNALGAVGAYAYITAFTFFIAFGYARHHGSHPSSIKGGLVVSEDGGLHIVEPEMVEESYRKEIG